MFLDGRKSIFCGSTEPFLQRHQNMRRFLFNLIFVVKKVSVLHFSGSRAYGPIMIHIRSVSTEQSVIIFFFCQICPGLNAYEMHVLYDRHHKESSLIKVHQSTPNSVKYEVMWGCQVPQSHIKYLLQYTCVQWAYLLNFRENGHYIL